MSRSIAAIALALAASAAGAALFGCSGPHPFIHDGDMNSVEIGYSGDVASTLPLARRHCGQFERVPRLVDPGLDIAIFDCVRP
jgi:hypothetical protein